MGVSSLPKTVTRQCRGCDLEYLEYIRPNDYRISVKMGQTGGRTDTRPFLFAFHKECGPHINMHVVLGLQHTSLSGRTAAL